MRNDPCKLIAIEALPDYHLKLTYIAEQVFEVDLSNWINETRGLFSLQDPDLFIKAQLMDYGVGVYWIKDELELGADNLRNLGIEQSGGIGHERIWNWLYEMKLTPEQGAKALGITLDELLAYRDGLVPIPRILWLACVK